MSPTILGGVAALLLFAYWSLRRRSPVLLRSTDASSIAALNRAQIALMRNAGDDRSAVVPAAVPEPSRPPANPDPAPSPPAPDARQRAALLARLERQLSGDAPSRLQAMRTARQWGHVAVLPLLRRGLRDVDLAVVLEAAQGIERFRCSPRVGAGVGLAAAQLPLPRNVSRMR